MEILDETIERELPDLARAGGADAVRRPARPGAAPTCASGWTQLERSTAELDTLALWIAFDYGGRAELVEAARRCVADGLGRRRDRRGGDRGAAVRAGAARDRPPDPDLRRVPDLELHALGDRLRRVRLHRDALARLRRRRPAGGARGVRRPATGGSAADERRSGRASWSRSCCCRSCSASSGSAAGGSSRSPSSAA